MDDRIRRENSEKPEEINKNTIREGESASKTEGSINSGSFGAKINPTAPKAKRFEVHIPESADFKIEPEKKNDAPARIPAPAGRPSADGVTPPRRPAPGGVTPPRRPAPGGTMPPRRPAPGGTTPPRRPLTPEEIEKRRAAQAQRGTSLPRKRTATGRPDPVTPEAQLAAKKAAERKAREVEKKAKEAEKLQAKKTKAAKKAEKKKDKVRNANFGYNFAKGLLTTCVCVLFVGTIVYAVSSIAFSFINDILVINKEDKNYSVTVEIPEGATYDDIFDILVDKGIVEQPLLTDFFCKFRHYDSYSYLDEETGVITEEIVEYTPGVYHLDADSGIENILDSMLAYNDVEKETVRVTFPEGFTIAEIFEKLEKYGVCETEKLYANLDVVANQYEFLKQIPDSEGRYQKAEGYLFPDTYDFYVDESASSVLEKLFDNFNDKWTAEYDNRLKTLGLTKDQVIAIASIIQAEAKDGSQMADISAVIHNRLNNSASYPTLDMDSTADYIKDMKALGILSDVHYSMYVESYNTYSQIGIPPGPICSPGETAINAALYPSDSEHYFFCHDPNGEIYFASTASEHQENVERVVYGNVGETE